MMNESDGTSLKPVAGPLISIRLRIVAALLSSLLPGLGHFCLKRTRTALILLLSFGCVVIPSLLFRIPATYVGFAAEALALLMLTCVASCSAFITRAEEVPLRKWWLLAGLVCGLFGFSVDWNAFVRGAGFKNFSVPSTSMGQAVVQGDEVMADMRAYRESTPAHGDVIVFKRSDGIYYCKRVIATQGETIEGRDGEVFVDGVELDEPYAQHSGEMPDRQYPELRTFGPLKVPTGELFVLGDERDYSVDSRMKDFGLARAATAGKVLYVIRSSTKDRIGKQVK